MAGKIGGIKIIICVGMKNLRKMAADFGIIERRKHCWVIVPEGQTGDLSEGIQDDVSVGVNDVISRAFVKVDDDLCRANILNLVKFFHRLRGEGTRP